MKKIGSLRTQSRFGWNILLAIVIGVTYGYYVSPNYAYMGFLSDFSIARAGFSLALLILLLSLCPLRIERNRLSSLLVYFLFVVSYYPMLVLYVYGQAQVGVFGYYTVFWILILVLHRFFILVKVSPLSANTKLKLQGALFAFTILYACYLVFGVFGFRFDVSLLSFIDPDIYVIRGEVGQNAAGLNAYFATWIPKVFIPLLFMVYYANGRRLRAGLLFVLTIFLYMSLPHKGNVLILPVAIVFYHVYNPRSVSLSAVPKTTALTIGVLLFGYLLMDLHVSNVALNLLVRRTMFVPSQLALIYYDFFSVNQPYYFSASFLRGIVHNPYVMGPVHLIATTYFGRIFSPNTGLFGDAFAQLGYIGLVVYPFLLNLAFALLDSVCYRTDTRLLVGMFVAMAMSFLNSAMFTVFLTHGFLLSVLMVWAIIPDDKNSPVQTHD